MSTSTPLGHRAEVVVIGGGIMGASIAYHLARAGITDVTVLEAGEVACGSSGKPLGGVRVQFSDRANIELGLRSLHAYGRFAEEIGKDIGLRRVGYLFALRDPADVAPFEASIALQTELGAVSRVVGADEAVTLCPYLDASRLIAAAWSPGDGFARPADAVRGYLDAASALGVTVRTGTRVVGIDRVGACQALVRTADGHRYRSPAVVCATGAWSRAVGEMAGVLLPVDPLRRQIAFTPPLRPAPPRVPFTIDFSTTAYFHPSEEGGLVLGMSDSSETTGFDRAVTDTWHAGLRDALSVFAPDLASAPIARGWAGLYEMTPDCNGLIGEADPGFRFLYAAGFSGHGFLQGPAVGESVRDLYVGRTPAVDVSCFDARRFERPTARTELGII
ncbi:MAG: FAD-binding oxidoreductase [Pseudonocardia sp.]|nr:FAD-binding oxidoreductase [Pseudonocardia sp.]